MRKRLWEPSLDRKKQANMTRFIEFVNQRYVLKISDYQALYQWSIAKPYLFWEAVWEFSNIKASKKYSQVLNEGEFMLESNWFPGAELNFAENLLRFRDNREALIFKGEAKNQIRRMTYHELYEAVAKLAKSLRELGVTKGDRIAGFMPNIIETVVAMLATASIGAIWSSCSPDFGTKGVYDRFGQIKPKVLFATNGYWYNGKKFSSLEKVKGVAEKISSIEKVIIIPYLENQPILDTVPKAVMYQDFISPEDGLKIDFAPLPFNHPLYIMYSSGTTGVPKCIVHGSGGTLIQHLKELILHTDLKREDKIFYYTTCGWMMWNWLVSSLAVGATVVLFDGSPFYPSPQALWELAEEERISIFGTSAKYIEAIEKAGVKPKEFKLTNLKTILSTGSPLSSESFEYVYRDIKKDVCLSSISGGTDIISCFALGNPIGPVYAGELQCRGLGMKVESFDPKGRPHFNQKGDLVCSASFPSMPIYFWQDPDKVKYKNSYFCIYDNIWCHGDYIEINDDGGVIIYGRSDATLNPGGVRIGTAEIYRQVETIPEVLDSIVVGQRWENDVRIILFVKLVLDQVLDANLTNKIKLTIRENTTPRHVPAKIIAVKDIPYTISGKKVEIAVRNIIHHETVANQDALANPESLEYFKGIKELEV